jgi:hypothetical protein
MNPRAHFIERTEKSNLSVLQSIRRGVKARRSFYYSYARKHILCECPLCLCPGRHAKNYSFVYVRNNMGIIYYDIPKCASSSIRSFFLRLITATPS